MEIRLTDKAVKDLPLPESGYRITFDGKPVGRSDNWVPGFGVRVTAAGARSFILNYRNRSGRSRRITIGSTSAWDLPAARKEAKRLRNLVDRGEDPAEKKQEDRRAKTVGQLCDEYLATEFTQLRPSTQIEYEALIEKDIRSALKHIKVGELAYSDVAALHRKVTRRGATYTANRVIAVLSRMLSLAVQLKWRTDNPAKGVKKNPEEPRERYLTDDELVSLSAALTKLRDQQAATIIRLLMLTGARRGETLKARWADINLETGHWTKPGATTKRNTVHHVPLSMAARQLLLDHRSRSRDDAEYVFPGRGTPHRIDIKFEWRKACIAAGIVDSDGKPTARLHDLRHTYASLLVNAGESLPIIGKLLGHTQQATTMRYAHLADDPQRRATERVGAIVAPNAQRDNVIPLKAR